MFKYLIKGGFHLGDMKLWNFQCSIFYAKKKKQILTIAITFKKWDEKLSTYLK